MKNLIILCDEKSKEYANYLSQLISMEDDTEDTTVGVKDGSVQAQVWLEKDYKANSATISSTQHIVFIGNGKLLKEQRSHMKNEFSNYGMVHSKLGRRAAIYVDDVVALDKYNEFISFAQNYEKDITKLVNDKSKKVDAAGVAAGAGVGAGAVLGGKAMAAIIAPVALAPLIGLGVSIPLAKRLKLKARIKDQMYSCAIMKFYLEDLNKFLGLE